MHPHTQGTLCKVALVLLCIEENFQNCAKLGLSGKETDQLLSVKALKSTLATSLMRINKKNHIIVKNKNMQIITGLNKMETRSCRPVTLTLATCKIRDPWRNYLQDTEENSSRQIMPSHKYKVI